MSTHHKTLLFFLSVLLILTCLSFFWAIGFGYFVATGLIWFGVVLYGSANIGSNYHVRAYCKNPSETARNIAITFDDGPNPMTLQILEILKNHQATATFFCIGKNIETHPQILKRIVDEGHVVGNHSYSHSHFFDFFGKDRVIEELRQTDELIENITGKKPIFFRPPYGVTNRAIGKALKVVKHKVIGWNIRSLDGGVKNERFIFNRIKNRISPGGIILLHDTSQQSANVLERLLTTLREKKYEVVSLEHLLDIKAYEN